MKPIIGWIVILFSLVSLGCAGKHHGEPVIGDSPERGRAVRFFSNVHTIIRDTERGVYNVMFGIRDGVDGFIYDIQKDYYEDYQK